MCNEQKCVIDTQFIINDDDVCDEDDYDDCYSGCLKYVRQILALETCTTACMDGTDFTNTAMLPTIAIVRIWMASVMMV